MSFLDMFRIGQIKQSLAEITAERNDLQAIMKASGALELEEVKKKVLEREKRKTEIDQEIREVERQIQERRQELVILDDEILLQSFGLYKPRYELANAAAYRLKLDVIRENQASMVKAGEAAHCPTGWTVNNDKKEGARMIRDYSKLIVRAFNNECDTSIAAVKFHNVEAIAKRIRKAFETLNKLGSRMNISIVQAYLELKLEELLLAYEYQVKKQEEKEEQKKLREQMREEARLLKEIEEARAMLDKEEKHFRKALASLDRRVAEASTETEKTLLEEERALIAEKLEEVMQKEKDIDYRQQNTRAGYVYIISNVGSFGQGVYKIGVTRRLDPVERVDELSDASVPYDFDIHAIIFSDDAPSLETALHRKFTSTRVNLVNLRREFFRTTVEEIEAVVKENFQKPVEFAHLAEAAEFRQSEKMRELSAVAGIREAAPSALARNLS
jgi:hypothetical protein